MSGASSARCLTMNWEIKNFSIMLFEDAKKFCKLKSPIWKTETRESKVLCHLRLDNKNHHYFTFQLICINMNDIKFGHYVFVQCEMSLFSSEGEISLECHPNEVFTIEKSKVQLNRQYFLPGDTLTVRCRMLNQELTTEDFIIRSVLQEVNLNWAEDEVNLNSTFHKFKYLEDSKMLFHMTWDYKPSSTVHYSIEVEISPIRCACASLLNCNFLIWNRSDKYYAGPGQISEGFIDSLFSKWRGNVLTFPEFKKLTDAKLFFALIIATHDELPVYSSADSTKVAIDSETPSSFPGTLSNDLLLLYREGKFGDVTLKTEDKSLWAHKNILSARSKVFRAMFESKHMKESNSGTVDIDDIDSATLDRMLVFLYGESLDDMSWEEASELYYAADKYEIDILKRKCGEMLSTGLTVSNACDALVLADTHADEELMRNALDFVRGHDEVIYSAEWEKLEDSNSRLAAKVTRDLYSFLKKGKK